MDALTFSFIGLMAFGASYFALRPSRPGDIDNLYTGGVAFLLWLVWSLSAYNVKYNVGSGTPESGKYAYLAYFGFAMAGIMLLGLMQESFERLDEDGRLRQELGL